MSAELREERTEKERGPMGNEIQRKTNAHASEKHRAPLGSQYFHCRNQRANNANPDSVAPKRLTKRSKHFQ